MRRNPRAELHREHLGAQANPQERPLLAKRHGDPVDLPANEIVGIVGTHRAAENDRAGMTIERFRKRIAEARTPDIERIPSARNALPTRPGVEVSWCRTISTGSKGSAVEGATAAPWVPRGEDAAWLRR